MVLWIIDTKVSQSKASKGRGSFRLYFKQSLNLLWESWAGTLYLKDLIAGGKMCLTKYIKSIEAKVWEKLPAVDQIELKYYSCSAFGIFTQTAKRISVSFNVLTTLSAVNE